MARRSDRDVLDLLTDARRALRMTQAKFGDAVGASPRTASRWEARQSRPGAGALRTLATLLVPVDAALAAEAAAHAGETLESLGLVQPPAPPPPPPAPAPAPAPPPPPRPAATDLADIVVCAAADATGVAPSTVRPTLYLAFRRAREVGLTVEEVEQALAPKRPEAKPRAK